MTREEFNNNSYLVNNNALYNKHTEHISTTEPLYLDGMPGSDNLIHKKPVDDGGDTLPQSQFFKIQFNSGYVPVKVLNNAYGIYLYGTPSNLIVCNNNA